MVNGFQIPYTMVQWNQLFGVEEDFKYSICNFISNGPVVSEKNTFEMLNFKWT